MFLSGADRYDSAEKKLRKRIRFQILTLALVAAAYILAVKSFFWPFEGSGIPTYVSIDSDAAIILALLAFWPLYQWTSVSIPVEDLALLPLRHAEISLAEYLDRKDKDSRKSCVRHLREASRAIEKWKSGNLGFLKEGVGSKIEQFQKGFRERLVPAVEKAGDADLTGLLQFLRTMKGVISTGALVEEHLDRWNQALQRYTGYPTKPGTIRKLVTKTNVVHLAVVALGILFSYGTFRFARETLGTTADTAFTGAITILGLVIGSYLAWRWKVQS